MQLHRPFRFGIVTHNTNASLDALVTRARLAERLGYSAFLIPDHLGDQFDTPLALALVAQSTSTLRVGSFVFANDFRHPALLAKTAATLDVISGGRFEWGMGAVWMQSEYEQVGLAFGTPRVRIDRMVEALQVIKGLFSGDPVNSPLMTCRASTMRSIRTRGVPKASPTCSYSDCIHPAPRPNSNRPPEITSRVAAVFANRAGWRKSLAKTKLPTRSVLVDCATSANARGVSNWSPR